MKAMVFHESGGPDVLAPADLPDPVPGRGQVVVRHRAIGVNFIDTYHRSGLYPVSLPGVPGMEAAGVVEAVGEGVEGFAPGDPVVYLYDTPGSYAEARAVDAAWLHPLPGGLAPEEAAAVWLKGATAEFLVERCARVQPGQTVLVPAAAGGMGLLLVRWLKHVGATVIGTTGGGAKAEVARAAGADHVLAYGEAPDGVRALTGGRGVDAVIDGVGRDTFDSSVRSLRPRGIHISYGNASGPIGPVDFAILARLGSLWTTRPALFDYYREAAERRAGFARVGEMVAAGVVVPDIRQRWRLSEAAEAHRALEGRATTGASVLLP